MTSTPAYEDAADASELELADFEPQVEDFRRDLLAGLRATPKKTHPKYLYDREGSLLFDGITRCEDYYPTKTELSIYANSAREIGETIGKRAMLVEPGAGNGEKAMFLLARLDSPASYVPVEISREHLVESSHRINEAFPKLEVLPVVADFTADHELPTPSERPGCTVVWFPGSTIGNFEPRERIDLLHHFADLARKCHSDRSGVLIGFDMVKPVKVLERAYDDSEGITAAFNLNLLARANRELGADFDLDNFRHRAIWNPDRERVEMHLIARKKHEVRIGKETVRFEAGESIHTESSHKFTVEGFARSAAEAGLELERHWTDDRGWFCVAWFKPSPPEDR